MRLLTIEDDESVATALKESLRSSYLVEHAGTGKEGLMKVRLGKFDVVILDVHLTDITGIEVCQAIKLHQPETPVLVLSGDATIMNKIALLDAGAEDYITKPFSLGELKARLRTITRRKSLKKPASSQLTVGELYMDIAKHTVTRQGATITLRKKEFSLLECLMVHADTIVTRAMLINYAWGDNEETWTNTVDVHIKFLRDKIDKPYREKLIKTVHGLGYKLETPAVCRKSLL